ncbi:hypothetical protein HU147_18460 [Planomicrobium chinense]|uniref:hypothetical protein n=1 Tax=Planococcus chinensis TaxID=272917 RepID=UPI001CC438B2|nr:hypothetical protein [Planococcus chinensis]MBZ5203189.1 hypothetical protein [Planococcus chinensis]
MEETKNIQLFVNVDEEGNIIDAQMGVNIVQSDPFPFFFLIDEEMAANISDYKVVIEGMKPKLVLKSAE